MRPEVLAEPVRQAVREEPEGLARPVRVAEQAQSGEPGEQVVVVEPAHWD